MQETAIDPPIMLRTYGDTTLAITSVEQLIDYVRRHPEYRQLERLRDAAFVAAAVPSTQNIDVLRKLTAETFADLRSR